MSDRQAILIDLGSSDENQLKFQEFPSQTTTSPVKDDRQVPALSSTDGHENSNSSSIWSLEYFQKFFDVDTDTVVERIWRSVYPKSRVSYLQYYINTKPDLYGPFWVCVTLVFTIAISGNMANYIQAATKHKYHWKYNFHAVSAAATAIFMYAWIFPVVLWGLLKYQGSDRLQLSLLELICVYGYSLSVYVPISVLWVIQISWVQWTLVFVGAALSGYVLITSISPAFGEHNIVPLFIVLCLHLLLAVGFMLFFFHVPPMHVSDEISVAAHDYTGNETKAALHE